jgi:hypothetical protein
MSAGVKPDAPRAVLPFSSQTILKQLTTGAFPDELRNNSEKRQLNIGYESAIELKEPGVGVAEGQSKHIDFGMVHDTAQLVIIHAQAAEPQPGLSDSTV